MEIVSKALLPSAVRVRQPAEDHPPLPNTLRDQLHQLPAADKLTLRIKLPSHIQ